MTVSKFTQPDSSTQNSVAYKANIDGAIDVVSKIGAAFAPHAADTPNMTIKVDAGSCMHNGARVSQAQQTATVTAPVSGDPRISRVVIDKATGAASVIDGAQAPVPVAPAIPSTAYPICQVQVSAGQTTITNAQITDERVLMSNSDIATASRLIVANETYTPPAGATLLRVSASGGGGGAGGGGANASGTSFSGGGGGGGGAIISNRLMAAENLTLVIGAGGTGGNNSPGNNASGTAGTAGGSTTITGVTSGTVITCAGGGLGGA